ncbi:MAG: hypothetical protein IPK80_26845 [Nannocystis sp.]|nr:hypothetical protein [Nannocystis sp.]
MPLSLLDFITLIKPNPRRRGARYALLCALPLSACPEPEGGDTLSSTTSTATAATQDPATTTTTTTDPTGTSSPAETTTTTTTTDPTTGPTTTNNTTTTTTTTDSDSDSDATSAGDCQLADILSEADWDALFLHKDDPACFGENYSYPGLIAAAADYPTFACEGDLARRRREVAAFLAQISHETTGGWADAPDGPYAWGLCFIEEIGCGGGGCAQYCDPNNVQYPCAPGETYHGRGAIQLSWNYNYGQAGDALGVDLLSDPGLVASDSKLAIQTALWFWMTPQAPKPAAHDVMAGIWQPSPADVAQGRLPGYGLTTNIINGGIECGKPTTPAVEDRVGFFTRYAQQLSVDVGDNLYCDQMAPYI